MAHNNKKLNGQFYTINNPFHNQLFLKWLNSIENVRQQIFLEPFAGANNIVQMIHDLGYKNKWNCFDLEPSESSNFNKYPVKQRDTLANFPNGFKVAITNPPYLAKNSAKRSGLSFPDTNFDDLYKLSLANCLENCDYVAAIIPDSFITSGLFHDRLYGVATLNSRLFEDTETPVCLALFVPLSSKNGSTDFRYFKGNISMGNYSEMLAEKNKALGTEISHDWKFNDPTGEIGLMAIDSTTEQSIRFVPGSEIADRRIKSTSRGVTKISNIPQEIDPELLVEMANALLIEFRENTQDMFLTSFRGLRQDGDYRKRLDYSTAREILNASIEKLGVSNA